jgi:hypothetical protein
VLLRAACQRENGPRQREDRGRHCDGSARGHLVRS